MCLHKHCVLISWTLSMASEFNPTTLFRNTHNPVAPSPLLHRIRAQPRAVHAAPQFPAMLLHPGMMTRHLLGASNTSPSRDDD